MNRKTRCDAVLKSLPEELQEQIIIWADEPRSETCPGGYTHASAKLQAAGIKTSRRRISDFYTWWQLRRTLELAEEDSEEAQQWMRDFRPGDEEAARKFGEFVFMQKAVRVQDVRVFRAAASIHDSRLHLEHKVAAQATATEQRDRHLAQRDAALQLATTKFQTEFSAKLLDPEVRAKAAAIAASNLSNSEKIAAMRQVAFAEIDELQASGAVVIPK